METLYLSKRNLTTLLHKLDTRQGEEASSCTIIKNDHAHPVYPQSLRRIAVTAVETTDRYFNEVSQRLHLSRATLNALLDGLQRQSGGSVEIDDMRVTAIADEDYYVDRPAEHVSGIGHITSALLKKWR